MKKYPFASTVIIFLAIFFPFFLYAGELAQTKTLLNRFLEVVNLLTIIAFACALLFFFWGIATFILASGDEAGVTEGKRKMIWGVTALFVIATIWGIVRFAQSELGFTNLTSPDTNTLLIPSLP